ncbi:hypothetical protein Spb1_24020 [Planctopirus ephydatiae]|uniref:Uncharacterized protein n=1 Tax=Planctopirus ephydatiae TaxID=2528019 RepID=A0A518GPB3_9PLAN|nr:hypothetical protein [Planctopirus ephydatiae]QDV30468.1 hypothetical protein Spb1_24020 [Planctopirus ephydatiae]
MTRLYGLVLILAGVVYPIAAADIQPPVHPDEAKIVNAIIALEGHSVEVAEVPGWAKGGIVNRLKEYGIETTGLNSWGIRGKENHGLFFGCVYDLKGRVLALTGNGPWLRDESLRALKGMPDLRIIRFDHNGFLKNHPLSPLYSGTGFDALSDSQLVEIKLTLGINDAGMEQAARIKGLKSFTVVHSQVGEAGVKFFEGHPSLESFTVAEMGKVSQTSLASIAKMPKVTHVGFQEAFITYEGGFEHLLALKGRLKTLDLSMSVVNDADMKRVQADHPDAKIIVIPPAEIVRRHSGVANSLARIATGKAAEELKKAIEASSKK